MDTPSRKKSDFKILQLKRAGMFFLGFAFFLFPGQNYYLTVSSNQLSLETRPLGFNLPNPAAYPVNFTDVKVPGLTAEAAVVLDTNSAVLIYGKSQKSHLLPASTVKIMSALITLEHYNLDDILTVRDVNNLGQDMKLVEGEQMTAGNLVYGLLVYSANDAAWVLAQNYPGGETEFIKTMNQRAKELHLDDTHFANPTGVNSDEKGKFLVDFSYTTALDLARLSIEVMKNSVFREIVATRKITVTDITGRFTHPLVNLNELLGQVEGVKGIKTGWTEDAEGCLVAYTERNGQGIVSVVLGSDDRFGETKKLINWVFANFQWQEQRLPSLF